MSTWAILAAGGQGNRYNSPSPLGRGKGEGSYASNESENKLLVHLAGKPVIQQTLETLCKVPEIKGIVIVGAARVLTEYQTILQPLLTPRFGKNSRFVEGGQTRRESVALGLQAIPNEVHWVLIHDAARPLVRPKRIQAAIKPVVFGEALATSLGMPVTNTIKQVQSQTEWVEATVDRSLLWQVHTPQVFQKELLLEAHQRVPQNAPITDDAELIERLYPDKSVVLMIEDDATNIKITTPTDLVIAEAFLKEQFDSVLSR